VVGYVPEPYTHQEYPKMLYHPDYGLAPRPDIAKFASDCRTADQYLAALQSFQEAEQKWSRGQRTKQAKDKKDEERLKKKGWLLSPPAKPVTPQFDMECDEL
jgi:hypothetical protein